ncbi:lmo1851 family serine protease [Niallia sp. 01092]|uniref:lmo1851 family serine protease n=1 Tax=unclassified Niallia TaxID=2837522 RepID=UPI003FD21811
MENEKNVKEPSENESSFIRMKTFHFVMLLFFTVILAAGITTVALSFGDEKAVNVGTDRSEFNKLYAAYDALKQNYYKDVDTKDLVNGAIDGMFSALNDPYSNYMNEKEAASFHESISSSFEGIGAEIQQSNDNIVIVTPIKGSPAEKAGLKPNDKIISVDGKNLQGMSSSEAVLLIRGKKGTKVELEIERAGVQKPMDISIVRDTIPIETVYGKLTKDGIAEIQITSFSENTSVELVNKLNEFQEKGMKGIVLDLRQNPGGLLPEVEKIANLFVPNGEIIYQEEHRNGKVEKAVSENNNGTDIPLVVMIDGGSASASEILAAAVNQSADVPLVGVKSFGKGTVQRATDLSDGSNLKFTTDKWLTPNGSWIHGKGIEPTYKVELPSFASLSIINPDSKLKKDSNSEEVKTAQQMLKALGYKVDHTNGYFDESTENATIEFQKKEKLTENGVITGETTVRLMNELRDKIQKSDTQMKKAVEVLKEEMKK